MANNTIINNETINNTNKKESKTMKKDYTLNGTINATTWQEFRTVMKEAGINTGTKSYEQLVEEYNNLPKENIVSVGDMSSDRYSEVIEEKETKEETDMKDANYYSYENTRERFLNEFEGGYYVKWYEYDENVHSFYDAGQAFKTKKETAKFLRTLNDYEDVELTRITRDGNYPEINITDFLKDIPVEIETLHDIILNKLLEELHLHRGKFDARGLIQVSNVYKAICKTFDGRLEDNFIKGVINYMITNKYIRFTKINGQLQLFLTFKDVVKDDAGKVIGVRNF